MIIRIHKTDGYTHTVAAECLDQAENDADAVALTWDALREGRPLAVEPHPNKPIVFNPQHIDFVTTA